MPTTVSLAHSIQGPTMHQQSTLSSSPPAANYFSQPSHKQRNSVASFDSRRSTEDYSPMNRPTLHQILNNQGRGQYTLDSFASFLQSQFCYENLAFWLASRQYKLCAQSLYRSVQNTVPLFDLHTESNHLLSESQGRAFHDLQLKMRAILDAFVLPSSPHELNLSDAIRCRLLRAVAEGNYHPQVLEQARESIMELMKSSSYPSFLEGIAAKRASDSGSTQSTDSEKSNHDQDNGSWRVKAKHHFKLVSKMLKRSP